MKLATFLAAHAARRPDRVAVISGDHRIRFAELDESTTRAADALRRRGVSVGDRVAILLPNGIEFVQALLATIKAGAVAVPVNTRLSAAERDYILDDCDPAAVFSGSDIDIGELRLLPVPQASRWRKMTVEAVDTEPVYYDPYDYGIDTDPHPVWRRMREEHGAVAEGIAEYAFRFAPGTAIYGGTTEIHRNLIAEHSLGLPRSTPRSAAGRSAASGKEDSR